MRVTLKQIEQALKSRHQVVVGEMTVREINDQLKAPSCRQIQFRARSIISGRRRFMKLSPDKIFEC